MLPDGARCSSPYIAPTGVAIEPSWYQPKGRTPDEIVAPPTILATLCKAAREDTAPFVQQVDPLVSEARQPALPLDSSDWVGHIEGLITYRVQYEDDCISGFSYHLAGDMVLADGRSVPIAKDVNDVPTRDVQVVGTRAYETPRP